MTQQAADYRQAQPAAGTEACIGVPEIVQTDASQSGSLSDRTPRALQVVARLLRFVTGRDVGTDALQPIQHRKGRGVEDDSFSAALAVGKEQTAALHIDVLPPQVQDF